MKDETTTKRLAYFYTLIFALVIAMEFLFAWYAIEINDAIQRMLDFSCGILFAMVLAAKDYYLGSSMGSARKTEIMSAPKPTSDES